MKRLRRVLAVVMLMLMAPAGAYAATVNPYDVSVAQTQRNYRGVTVTLKEVTALKKVADSVKVEVYMTYDGAVTQKSSVTKAPTSTIQLNAPAYGSYNVKTTFSKSGKTVKTVTKTLDVIADEYNIAPIVATYPVVNFSLNLKNITHKADGTPIPTIVSLQRPDAYNWDNLPENVFWQPNLTKAQVTERSSFDVKTNKMADYVATLVKANPDAKFNLYINDAYAKYILRLLVANGVPASNYHVYLLSDGSGSYVKFQEVFNTDNPQQVYDTQKIGWENALADSAANHKEDRTRATGYRSSRYVTMLVNEYDNIEWWVARKSDTFKCPDTAFVDKYIKNQSRVVVKNMNSMLTSLDATQSASFKALYDFNSQMFAKAATENKKVMMILGSRVGSTFEPDFRSYAKFLMKHFGDDYVYYYKGHPATPTAMFPEKIQDLSDLGIIDVESSIPAELILYFYPDIYMAGYSSSTFTSVESDEMAAGIFNKTKEEALADPALTALATRDAFGFYMKKTTDVSAYPGAEPTNDNFLVTFSEKFLASQGNTYDFAVYDATKDMLLYYKKDAGGASEIVGVSVELEKPSGFTNALSMSTSTLTARWTDQPAAEGYEVKYRTKYTNDWKTITVTEPQIVFSNLKRGQTIEYSVKALLSVAGKNFDSSESGVNRVFVLDKNCSTTLSYAKRTLKIAWRATVPQYGTMSYKVYYRVGGGSWKTQTTKSTSLTLSGLPTSALYEVKVVPLKTIGAATYTGTSGKLSLRYVRAGNVTSVTPGKTTATVTVGKLANTTGYEYAYSTSKTFSSAQNVSVKGASNTTVKLSSLSSHKTYYVKMRPYKIVDGKKYVGAWSSSRSFTTK